MNTPEFIVKASDNSRFDTTESDYMYGAYMTYEEAYAKCEEIVEDFLTSNKTEGMSAEELYHHYISFGEEPYIVSVDGSECLPFPAINYAKEQVKLICQK